MANYHVWHHTSLDGKPAFATTGLMVPKIGPPGTGQELKLFQSLMNDMDQLRADGVKKGIVDGAIRDVGASTDGLQLWALKVGKGADHKVLFTGCHHAREWISVEVPFLVAKYLIDHYSDAPQSETEKRVKHLVDNREIWFVPLVNADGHEHSVLKDRRWRPNRKTYDLDDQVLDAPQFGGGSRTIHIEKKRYQGVDLNRNYPTATWGQETRVGKFLTTSRDPNDAKNGIWAGPAAGSEVETQQILALMAAQNFRASITYHSFSQLLLYPSAAEKDAFVQFVGKGMGSLINANGNPYTYESGSALYPTTGDLMEFSYQAEPGRPTFTPEVRPTDAAPESLQFSGLPEAEIEPTFQENLGAALALINCAGFDAPAASVTVKWAPDTAVAQVVRNGWKVFQGFSP
jgi:hypothetical protein